MWVVALGLSALLILFGVVFLALGAWLRADEARRSLRLIQKRLAAVEQRLGIVRAEPVRAAGAGAVPRPAGAASLEEKIALVWFARIGAGILLVGALFFLLAPGGVSAPARVAAGAVFGFAALGFAEANRRHARPLFNQVVLGMGVAVLLVSAFVSHRLYGIASAGTATAAVAAAAGLGAFLAVRHRADVALALATAACLLAPPLLWPGAPPWATLAWLLAFPSAAAAVAVRWVFPWSLWLALVGSSGLTVGCALHGQGLCPADGSPSPGGWIPPLAFAVLFAAGWSLIQGRARAPGRERLHPLALLTALLLAAHGIFGAILRQHPAAMALAFAALGLAGALLLSRHGRPGLLLVPLAAGFLMLLGSVRPDSSPATILPLAAWGAVHGAALLRCGRAPLALSGAGGAIFLLVAGELLAPHRPRWFAVVVVAWSLAYARLAMERRSPALLAATGLLAFFGLLGAAAPVADRGDMVLALLCAAWSLVYLGGLAWRLLARLETPGTWHVVAAAGSGAALALLALLLTGPGERLARAGFFWGVAAAHLGLGLELLRRARRAAAALLAVGVGFAVLGVTFPLPGAGSTLAWAGSATALVGAGFARSSRLTRSLGLGLFAATVLKVAVLDLWTLGRVWQVSVLLGVGALLLVASYFYARRGARPREAAGRPAAPEPDEASGGD